MTKSIDMQSYSISTAVTMWFDPVCPYSWNTARWLHATAVARGFTVDWQLANLGILNDGRELPPPQQARMADSRRVGRLMAAIQREKGTSGLATAYFTFGQRYFTQPPGSVDDNLIRDELSRGPGNHTQRAHRCVPGRTPSALPWRRPTRAGRARRQPDPVDRRPRVLRAGADRSAGRRTDHGAVRRRCHPRGDDPVRSATAATLRRLAAGKEHADVSCGALSRLRQDHLVGMRCPRRRRQTQRVRRPMVHWSRPRRTPTPRRGPIRKETIKP